MPDKRQNSLYAHTPREPGLPWHSLREHLEAVGDLAASFASKFGQSELGRQLGLCHDLAKADPRFQEYLRASAEGRSTAKCPHSAPSARASRELLGPFAFAILGHHAGIPDKGEALRMLANSDPQSVQAAVELMGELIRDLGPLDRVQLDGEHGLNAEMLVRMAFSCLVDADFLDTERHFSPGEAVQRMPHPAIGQYLHRLDEHLDRFKGAKGKVNRVRAEILNACRTAAEGPKGAFRLTVPTGGGKTLSGLAFALNHANRHGMDRVIVAIPYTSIIEQTAAVYAEAVGRENILEHHSAIDFETTEDDQTVHELRSRLNCENWDCPLVVTTTVQLFESLLHNKPSRCRKLHNITNSVILLDEAQAVPPKTLGPILDVLAELVANYGCSVVFCTATQLDYSKVDGRLLKDAKEIVPEYASHFDSLKRVEYWVDLECRTVDDLAKTLAIESQALAVFNTRKDALRVAQAVRDLISSSGSLFHLSTLMCLHHRRTVIAEVRRRLQAGDPVLLVSTQVVEAGVDLDFPVVYRDVGPLDRIVQVAGRCNREGKLDALGRCVVFRLEGGEAPPGPYRTAIDITVPILESYREGLDSPDALAQYSRDLFRFTETGSLQCPNDRAEVQKLRQNFDFASVARTFRLIEEDTVPVIVKSYLSVEDTVLIKEWESNPAGWFRRIAPYTVSLFTHDLARLQSDGKIYKHESGAWIYSGKYDLMFGLVPELSDPADLIR